MTVWLFKSRAGRCWHRPARNFRTTHRAWCGRRLAPVESVCTDWTTFPQRICKGCFR